MISNEYMDRLKKRLEGKHAFLSGSNYHWIRYDDSKLLEVWENHNARELGTKFHKFAEDAIKLGVKLQKNGSTLSTYINDAIGFRMEPEVLCYYSDSCYGWADALVYIPKKKILRIHDLKTGKAPASMDQLKVYSAFYSLMMDLNPFETTYILRIYQDNDIREEVLNDGTEIDYIMCLTKHFSDLLESAED